MPVLVYCGTQGTADILYTIPVALHICHVPAEKKHLGQASPRSITGLRLSLHTLPHFANLLHTLVKPQSTLMLSRVDPTVRVIKNMTVTKSRQQRDNNYQLSVFNSSLPTTRGLRYNLRCLCRFKCDLFGD